MGREIRKVPADWEHPRYDDDTAPNSSRVGDYKPLRDEDYASASEAWMAGLDAWRRGERDEFSSDGYRFFWEYHGNPPDHDYWRERVWTEAEATHFQMYETVSEGTPLTPPMASLEALADYLVEHGDFWGQKRGTHSYDRGEKPTKWSREAANRFVQSGYAPSLVTMVSGQGVKVMEPHQMDGL